MRYTVLKAINGRSTRLKVGSTVGADEIADTVFTVDDLITRKFIEPVKIDVVNEEAAKPAALKARGTNGDKGE